MTLLESVVANLREDGIPHAVIGAMAMAAHGASCPNVKSKSTCGEGRAVELPAV